MSTEHNKYHPTPKETGDAEQMLTNEDRKASNKRFHENDGITEREAQVNNEAKGFPTEVEVPDSLQRIFLKYSDSDVAENWYYLLKTGKGKRLMPDFGWETDNINLENQLTVGDEEKVKALVLPIIRNFEAAINFELDDLSHKYRRFDSGQPLPQESHRQEILFHLFNYRINVNWRGFSDLLNEYLQDYTETLVT